MDNKNNHIAMFGHKRIPSREGGVEVVVEELATRMVKLGYHVTCYNRWGHHVSGSEFDGDKIESYKNVAIKPVFTIDKKGLAAVSASFFAAIACAFSKAKIIHIHAEGPAFMSWIPKLAGKRVIVTVHGLDWQREKWKAGFGAKFIHAGEKMAVKYADEIVVLSRNVQNYFMETYGRSTKWIPNGVSQPEITPADIITSKYGVEKDSYILFLGRLVPEKGIHYLIKAFRNANTNKKLLIAGGTSDTDEYINQLKSLASGDDRIVFCGFVQGKLLQELYSNAYIYVLPSDVEGMPLSLLEAMSYGNCCVTSDIEECVEVVGNHAIVFRRGDVEDLSDQLQKLCLDEETVQRYKSSAIAYICKRYDWDTVVDETLAIYGFSEKKNKLETDCIEGQEEKGIRIDKEKQHG